MTETLGRAAVVLGSLMFAAAPLAASAANFAGTWAFTGTTVMRSATFVTSPVCLFRQMGDRLAGSCKGPNAIGSADGMVNGNAFVFQWHTIATSGPSKGRTGTATFKGTWNADGVVRGSVTSTSAPGTVGVLTGQKTG